jgi:Leucine-rich repeat (LRR) protein
MILNRKYIERKIKRRLDEVSQVETIDLRGCKIAHIAEDSFKDLYLLENLILRNNNLTIITGNVFNVGLDNLRKLDLYCNDLKDVSESAFTNLSNLKVLSLNSNKLTHLYTDTFRSLENLEILELHFNLISKLTP